MITNYLKKVILEMKEQGYTNLEIARQLGIDQKTVKSVEKPRQS